MSTELEASESTPRIDGLIEDWANVFGEKAWECWGTDLARRLDLDLGVRADNLQVQLQQRRRFDRFMRALTRLRGSAGAGEIDLIPLPASGNLAGEERELVAALKAHGLLRELPIDNDVSETSLILFHSSIFDYWERAREWLTDLRSRLSISKTLKSFKAMNRHISEFRQYSSDHLVDILLEWPDESGDEGLYDWLTTGLIEIFDPNSFSLSHSSKLDRLPMIVLDEGKESIADMLFDKTFCVARSFAVAGAWIILAGYNGREEWTRRILEWYPFDQSRIANYMEQSSGACALLGAVQGGHEAVLALLLRAGANPLSINPHSGLFALRLAAQSGRLDIVRLLLDSGADVDQTDQMDGYSAILIAAQNGHPDIVRILLAAGADPDDENPVDQGRALMMAAQRGHTEVVRLLLTAGADPSRVWTNGTFALLQAAQNGFTETVAALLGGGANPNQIQERSDIFPLLQAAQGGHAAIAAMLIEAGATINMVNKAGPFSLLQAARNNRTEVVRLLLEKGADPKQTDKEGISSLLAASFAGHSEVIRLLLAAGADPNETHPSLGVFPLFLAAHSRSGDAVRLLLEAGAEPNRVHPQSGSFPLLIAAHECNPDGLQALLEAGADPCRANAVDTTFPLIAAAHAGDANAVRILLDAGEDPNRTKKQTGTSPLLQAIGGRHYEVARLLLSRGADPNQIDKTGGRTPMVLSAGEGLTEFLKLLAQHGGDPEETEPESGVFPLLIAAQSGHDGAIRVLLDCGADPNKRHADGNDPLVMAVHRGHARTVRLLLGAGANVNRPTQSGVSHLQVALGYLAKTVTPDRLMVAKLLIKAGADTGGIPPEVIDKIDSFSLDDNWGELPTDADSLEPSKVWCEYDSAEALPAVWHDDLAVDNTLRREINEIFEEYEFSTEEGWVSILKARQANLDRMRRAHLRHILFKVDSDTILEMLWISCPGMPPVAIVPGTDISALMDRVGRHVELDRRDPSTAILIVGLGILTSSLVSSFPILNEWKISAVSGEMLAKVEKEQKEWPSWNVTVVPGGLRVWVSWVARNSLVNGVFEVPSVGTTRMIKFNVVAQDVAWAIPRPIRTADGHPSAIRLFRSATDAPAR